MTFDCLIKKVTQTHISVFAVRLAYMLVPLVCHHFLPQKYSHVNFVWLISCLLRDRCNPRFGATFQLLIKSRNTEMNSPGPKGASYQSPRNSHRAGVNPLQAMACNKAQDGIPSVHCWISCQNSFSSSPSLTMKIGKRFLEERWWRQQQILLWPPSPPKKQHRELEWVFPFCMCGKQWSRRNMGNGGSQEHTPVCYMLHF